MNILRNILIATLALIVCQEADASDHAAPGADVPAGLELRDQFDAPQKLSFPTTNVTLLTIADKKGSEQIAGWVAPLRQRFGSRIDIRGIADVSTVPGPFRSLVRKKFQKLQSYPVMMDWSGVAVKAFKYTPGKADILVLDGRGRILRRINGEANDRAIDDLCGVVDRALAHRELQTATQ